MSKYITHRMCLLSLAYCDWYAEVCKKMGITEEAVLAKLHPKYKETKNGKPFGKDRCDRFMYWSNHRTVLDEDHYDRLRVLEEYIRLIYPRLVREVQKEQDIKKFFEEPSLVTKQECEQLTFNF